MWSIDVMRCNFSLTQCIYIAKSEDLKFSLLNESSSSSGLFLVQQGFMRVYEGNPSLHGLVGMTDANMLLLSPDSDTIITLTQLERERERDRTELFDVICDLHLLLWLRIFQSCFQSYKPFTAALWCGKEEEIYFRSFGMNVLSDWTCFWTCMKERDQLQIICDVYCIFSV